MLATHDQWASATKGKCGDVDTRVRPIAIALIASDEYRP
jgi:hypothetical protein